MTGNKLYQFSNSDHMLCVLTTWNAYCDHRLLWCNCIPCKCR